ncbi:uncharacterized protein LOC115620255 isoform X2 [Scaptodrosophila lebanonensis]|uniref:Uncharacterized protein LOC115620255 isoform X2 n=1 Tax=Drosophila lebanonensis TaxID=7225 RepID=A0A6J2SXG2_DROLE|nr:uncharacterized protein LOC115620255 isoform X2 [Scaptodrosophila lebanonensis]
MEEISSLDSFGGDSNARPDTETPKMDEENSKEKASAKEDAQPATPSTSDKVVEEGDAPEEEEGEKAVEADKGGGGGDEDFEQISEGSLEMDEQSQDAKAETQEEEKSTSREDDLENDNKETAGNESAENIPEPDVQPEGRDADGDIDEEEEVEHAIDAMNNSKNSNLDEGAEVDALGQSDIFDNENGDAVDGAPASSEAMDVDEAEGSKDPVDESVDDAADVEMRSLGGESPRADDDSGKKDVVDNEAQSEGHDEVDGSVGEPEDEPADDNEKDAEDTIRGDDDAEAEPVEDGETGTVEDAEAEPVEDAEAEPVEDVEAEPVEDAEAEPVEDATEGATEGVPDDTPEDAAEDAPDAEHGDDTVENVLEPEESDVCLIPDDPETEVTEAEKEIARENAEKAAEEEEAAEQSQAAAKSPDNELGAIAQTETSADNEDANESSTAEGAETNETETQNDVGGDMPENEEPTAEEAAGTSAGEVGVTTKTIIGWIVPSLQKCRQCGEDKICGFRYKKSDAETAETAEDAEDEPQPATTQEYLCEQACCDALLSEVPGKFFVRRKKFLVEEVSNEDVSSETSAHTPTTTEGEDTEQAADKEADTENAHKKSCIHCKEQKKCKYFLKQDQETFYICNDDCFNLLSAEEPDKYKLKRHSIRVRNIGATTIRSPTKKPESVSVLARTNAEADAARLDRMESFRRRCADCLTDIIVGEKLLVWETMDFCNEICLGSYQRRIGSKCETCKQEVSSTALGKYCVRFGFDVRQFCCAGCLNTYKKGLKTCSCCQKDISSGQEGFLAPVGDKDQFKDFCSQVCLRRYDNMCNPKKKLRTDICGVCNHEKPVRVEMLLDDKEHYFCSNPCFSAFKFVSNVNADPCSMCCKYFERKSLDAHTIYADQQSPKMFCSRICINVYIINNRHIVSCQWCKVKKYNFDMISKVQGEQETLTCSINCLTMHGVSCNISARAVTKCDNCSNTGTPQYHLTMSDASIRNFCTYQCVMQFQNQFARAPLTLESDLPSTSSKTQQSASPSSSVSAGSKNAAPFPTGLPKRVKLKLSQQTSVAKNNVMNKNKSSSGTVVPVISTVTSLASGETQARIGNVTVSRRGRGRGRPRLTSPPSLLVPRSVPPPPSTAPVGRGRPRKHVDYSMGRSPSPPSVAPTMPSRRNTTTGNDFHQSTMSETKIITVPPYPKAVRNVVVSCKPMMVSTGEQITPSVRDCATQTEKDYSNKVLIPVPVPIYLPQPMYMYSAPFPVPVPIPLPIPVPIFIPTTRNTAAGILKEIKKIQDKMPEDPLEAELLMMAEMVAEEKHESDSDSDNEIKPDPSLVNLQYQNNLQPQHQQQQQVVDVSGASHNPYGDDMLQIALKMATGDYEQHHQTTTVDLETTMTANTISNQSPGMVGHDSMGQMGVHHLDQQHHMLDASQRSPRGRKRGNAALIDTTARNNRSPVKRQRGNELDHSALQQQSVQQQQQEKPDAQMFLKYTFGVNAWKQWVMTKNADIEKSSVRRRPFKTELLQMTADELNYSLCLFVKEVRKPNGTEYAPDTIYYLVLGIQQYLYVNGRIDNIFYDPYYERFTECLDEVARKFSVLYNDSQYIVTRVEEEHLWECKQLGAHSPHVLLSTLMFFNTKHFNLTTVEEHMQLSFSHIMKHWKRSSQNSKVPGTRNVLLRFYPPQAGLDANPRKKKVYEQQENEENPLRCPVRLYEFYLSKCPESVKTRNDVFYLQPERSCVPDSPVWYSTQALSQDALQRMLHRVKMVKEINIALLTT